MQLLTNLSEEIAGFRAGILGPFRFGFRTPTIPETQAGMSM